MPAAVQIISGPRVTFGASRGSVAIGTGKSRVVLSAAAVATLQSRISRVTLSPAPRVELRGGKQGIAGPPGPGAEIEIYVAAESIGGHRAVSLDGDGLIIPASSVEGVPAFGLIRDAVVAGGEVAVYRAGRVGGFTGLIPGETYYLGAAALLTLTPPVAGVLQPLGVAASATDLLVDPDYPTFL